MDIYVLTKRFRYERRLQAYMYVFMYVNTKTIPLEDYFTSTETFVTDYKNISTQGTVPKYWLVFS